ncbi:tetratricopeptide repeat protein [bacterium]|nr:tetratricopeptide repeat protein [bacterium]
MSEGDLDAFKGHVLPDGRRVSIEDTEVMFGIISENVEDREKVCQILRGLIDECLNAGFLEAALSYLDKEFSCTDDPGRQAKIHLTSGTVFERMEDYKSAVEHYRAAFELPKEKDETWYFLHNNLGYCLNRIGLFAEAEKYCRTAIEIDPRRYNAYKNLGLAMQGQGKYPAAASLFLNAIVLFPPDPRSFVHLEEILSAHREEVERELPGISEHLAMAVDARKKLMQ